MDRIGDDLGGRSRRRRRTSKSVRANDSSTRSGAPASPSHESELALAKGETVLGSAPFFVRESHGSVGDLRGRVALVVTDRRLLVFRTSGKGRSASELLRELPRPTVNRVISKGTATEILVEDGGLTIQGSGFASQQSRQDVLRALGATTTSPNEPATQRCEREAAWRSFAELPGAHLAVRSMLLSSRDVVTAEGELLCSSRRRGCDLFIGDRHFVVHMGGKKLRLLSAMPPYELLDASSGQRVLYLDSRNWNLVASGLVHSPSHRYTFPVSYNKSRLWWLRFPVMSAVDETGKTVARYRRARPQDPGWKRVEIVVDAEESLNDELVLLLTTTANFLDSFFEKPRGGAG
jgi:hypothetical protein